MPDRPSSDAATPDDASAQVPTGASSGDGGASNEPTGASRAGDGAAPRDTATPEPAASALEPRLRARRPGLAIAALASGALAMGTTEAGTQGIVPQLAADLGASIPQAGTLVSAYALGAVIGAPLLAILGGRFPRRGLLLGLIGLYAVAHLALLGAQNFEAAWLLRFLSGFPHGAFLGVASLVAADLVPLSRRTAAVAGVMLGFPAANLVLAPLATALAQDHGWRALYAVVATAALVCVAGVLAFVPAQPAPPRTTNPLAEVRVLRRTKVWLTLLTASLGFGGSLATMAYISPTLQTVTGLGEGAVPVFLALYGVGSASGAVVADRLSRRGLARGLVLVFVGNTALLAVLGLLLRWPVGAVVGIVLLGTFAGALVPMLQTRLMEVAHGGQSLAAALNQSTLNLANALGAWLGGVTIAAGLSYEWPSRAGAALAACGAILAVIGYAYERRHPEA